MEPTLLMGEIELFASGFYHSIVKKSKKKQIPNIFFSQNTFLSPKFISFVNVFINIFLFYKLLSVIFIYLNLVISKIY